MKAIVWLALGCAALAGCSEAPDKPEVEEAAGAAPVAPAAAEQVAEVVQVIAYYFHGTFRCETCLRIEKQAQELIKSRFATEVASEQLVFKPVNYDKPENAHFLKDYKLPCPSLVLVRQKGDKDQEWKLLNKTWEHVENLVKFNEYVEGEVEKFLHDPKRPA